MTTALEIEQIAAGPERFRLFVMEYDNLVVHGGDKGAKPAGYSEAELSRSLIAERGLREDEIHLLIAAAKARYSAARDANG